LSARFVFLLMASVMLAVPAWSGHTLSPEEHQVLRDWLGRHPKYRPAKDKDCDCAGNIEEMRQGKGGDWKPVRDYHPYVATGDFNGDGVEDFAVVLIDGSKQGKNFALIVFNGPFRSETLSPAFIESGMDLKYIGLFYGPPRPKPYRLLLGPFESDSGGLLVPHGRGYQWDDREEE
jgi:hypothetical protein